MKMGDILDVKTYTPSEIAKYHGVALSTILSELEIGIKVESEHTTDSEIAREIALDHLYEFPDYYTRLKGVEE